MREDTDIAAEIARLEEQANTKGLDAVQTHAMLRAVEDIIADLKKDAAETAAVGISMAVTKQVQSSDYHVTIELQQPRAERKGNGFFSKLFGR